MDATNEVAGMCGALVWIVGAEDIVGTLCVVLEVAPEVILELPLEDARILAGVVVGRVLEGVLTETLVAAMGVVVGLVLRDVGVGVVLTMPTT